MTSETSLLYCASCHQSYRIGLTFIDPISIFTQHCYTPRILNNIQHSSSLFICSTGFRRRI